MMRSAALHDSDTRSDGELADAVRDQDTDAFGVLYARHYHAAHHYALLLSGAGDGAEDLVAEACAKVLRRLRAGGGPTTAFRSYLITTIRTTFYTQLRHRRWIDPRVDPQDVTLSSGDGDPVLAAWEARAVRVAMGRLAPRWRRVIWLLEIHRCSRAQVGEVMGLNPNAVSVLAWRARRALRVAYLQAHVNTRVGDQQCRQARQDLAGWLCGDLTGPVRSRISRHVAGCHGCTGAARELADWARLPRETVTVR